MLTKCRDGEAGSFCIEDEDCDENCVWGTCRDGSAGSSCTYDTDCLSKWLAGVLC